MIDYETTTSYALLITATDLVIPATDRKTVKFKSSAPPLSLSNTSLSHTGFYLCIHISD